MKKNNGILLSFVVCCYNVADYLENMVGGLLNQINSQTLKDSNKIEIILVEDGSTDNNQTKNICKKYERNFENIKLVQHKNNKGLSESRNDGVLASKGKYISFPDPDDELAKGIVEKYINIINNNNYDVICSGLIEKHWNNKGKLILTKEVLQREKTAEGKENIAAETIDMERNILFGYVWNKLYKRNIIIKKNIKFNNKLKFVEDAIFNIEYFKHAKTMYCLNATSVIYNRRLHSGNSLTSKYEDDYFPMHYLRIEEFWKYWKGCGVLNQKAKTVLSNLYFRYALSAIWRNQDKKSNMSNAAQAKWIKEFYELDLTKKLIKYLDNSSLTNKITQKSFQKRNINSLMRQAKIIDFVTTHFNNALIRLRQNR